MNPSKEQYNRYLKLLKEDQEKYGQIDAVFALIGFTLSVCVDQFGAEFTQRIINDTFETLKRSGRI